MEIVPLGVGSAFAKTLDNTNFLIRPGRGEPFILDCGITATRALTRQGVPPQSLCGILLSHLHADHIGGLEEMGFSGIFAWGRKVDLYLPKPLLQYLWPNSLSGGMGQRLKNAEGEFSDAEITTYFNVHPIGQSNRLSIGSIEITAFRTPHIPGRPSWGFFMHDTATGGKVMFTCDSQLSKKNLEKFGREADVVFHDCQLNGAGEGIHTGLKELVKLPEEMRKNILLTHYGDDWEKFLGKTGGMEFAKQDRVYKF